MPRALAASGPYPTRWSGMYEVAARIDSPRGTWMPGDEVDSLDEISEDGDVHDWLVSSGRVKPLSDVGQLHWSRAVSAVEDGGVDLDEAAESELGREDGPRPSVLKALRAAGADLPDELDGEGS